MFAICPFSAQTLESLYPTEAETLSTAEVSQEQIDMEQIDMELLAEHVPLSNIPGSPAVRERVRWSVQGLCGDFMHTL